jgi:hypothetical protein
MYVCEFLLHYETLCIHIIKHRKYVSPQILGLCCAVTAFALAVASVDIPSQFHFVHAIVGIVAMILIVLQPFNAIL